MKPEEPSFVFTPKEKPMIVRDLLNPGALEAWVPETVTQRRAEIRTVLAVGSVVIAGFIVYWLIQNAMKQRQVLLEDPDQKR